MVCPALIHAAKEEDKVKDSDNIEQHLTIGPNQRTIMFSVIIGHSKVT